MKILTLLLLASCFGRAQTKATRKSETTTDKKSSIVGHTTSIGIPVDGDTKTPVAGAPCPQESIVLDGAPGSAYYPYGVYVTSTTSGVTWEWMPVYGQIWNCKNKKWERDHGVEEIHRKHTAFMDKLRADIVVARLAGEELDSAAIREAVNPSRSYNGFVCYGENCFQKLQCNGESEMTSQLVAQLSFWNPSESELPLSMLQSYVKGMNCDGGTMKAYQIMNDRIIGWLVKQK